MKLQRTTLQQTITTKGNLL